MIVIYLAPLVMVIGAALALIPNRAQSLGVPAFGCGLFFTLWALASQHAIKLL